MRLVNVHLDERGYTSKPQGSEFGRISKRIVNKQVCCSLKEFAEQVGEKGRSFTRALFENGTKRAADYFLSQELFAVDIDDGISFEEFIKLSREYGLFPFFVYKTFSYTPEKEKFRAVYLCDVIIENSNIALLMNDMFVKIFPESDTKCRDLSRLFLGGKGILQFNPNARISILGLTSAYLARTKAFDIKNYKRNVCNFAKSSGVLCEDGRLCIYDVRYAQRDKPEQYIKIGDTVIGLCEKEETGSSKILKKDNEAKKGEKNRPLPILLLDKKKMYSLCPLLKDFYERDISHDLKFLLSTNLLYIKGGKSIFFNGLKSNKAKWDADWNYQKYYSYRPQHCKNAGCPYVEECKCTSLYSKLSKKIMPLHKKDFYVSREEAECILKEYLENAIVAKDSSIYLIKAQTAIGKTKVYCDIAAKRSDIKFLFAVPTIKLQQEVCMRLESRGIMTYKAESSFSIIKMLGLDICEEVQQMYDVGCGELVKPFIRQYIEDNRGKVEDWKLDKIEKSLEMVTELDGSCCAVVTHKLLLRLPVNVLKKYCVVVDEDILMTLAKENREISMKKIKETANSTYFSEEIRELLSRISKMPDRSVYKMNQAFVLSNNYSREFLQREGGIVGLLHASVYCVDRDRDSVHYFSATSIPGVKIIVLSATLNEKLYRDYCENRKIQMHEVPEVLYDGKLLQYTHYSMSRECIKNIGKEHVLQMIKEMTECDNIITFKEENAKNEIYFGKVEGFNDYSGKNLVVLGTPHCAECVYLMLGKYLDYDVNDTLSNRRIERNGYSFPIMTYGNSHLHNLQMYFLESELEQAVGRARLLRNNCIVYVFSNFPLRQAEICQDDYLKKNSDEIPKVLDL